MHFMKVTGKKVRQIISLITCFLMLVAIAINKNQRVLGHEVVEDNPHEEAVRTEKDGTVVISTVEIGKDIVGFGGDTPLEIRLKDGIIKEVKPLENNESEKFFDKLVKSGLFSRWTGLTIEEALRMDVDAVTGATFSSTSIIATMKRGLQQATNLPEEDTYNVDGLISFKTICAIIVILAAVVLPPFVRFRRYREWQLALNVLVLGFWSGSFISYSSLVSIFSGGIRSWSYLVPAMLLVVGFILPLFGKKSCYCTWVCPLGSLQELAGRSVKYKIRISPEWLKRLDYFREGLWAVLMLFMWSGVLFQWMDYELFTAFLFRQASPFVIAATIIFLLLSVFVNRPYCRFVCPTGTLLRLSQNSK